MGIIESFNSAISSVGTQIGAFVKNMPNRVVPVKGYETYKVKANIPKIKGIKTETALKRGYLEQLNAVINSFMGDSTKDKVTMYATHAKIMKNSLAPVLIKLVLDQCFTTEASDDFMSVEVIEDNSAIREVLEEIPQALIDRTKLIQLLSDNAFDFCVHGELFFLKKRNPEGFVTELILLNGAYLYPIYDNGSILFYLNMEPDEEGYISIIQPEDVLPFFLRTNIVSIVGKEGEIEQVASTFPSDIKEYFPNYYKVGEPLLWDARKPLKLLSMLEFLSNLNNFKALAMPTLLSVGVEKIRDEQQVTELMDVYEEFFTDNSSMVSMDSFENMDADNIDYSKFSNLNIKVIPVEGSGKNNLTPIDLTASLANIDERAEKQKQEALQLAGFPSSVLEATGSTEVKNDLQISKRYRNTCIRVQRSIADPCVEFFVEDAKKYDLANYDLTKDSFNVTFKNIVGLDNIEDLEIQIATITQVSSVFDVIKRVSNDATHIKMDEAGVLEYIESNLRQFKSSQNLFKWVDKAEVGAEEDSPDSFGSDFNTDSSFEEDSFAVEEDIIEDEVSPEAFDELEETTPLEETISEPTE